MTSPRNRLIVAGIALAWGTVFFSVLGDEPTWVGLQLGALAGVAYIPNQGTSRGRAVTGIAAGAFLGLGSWLVVDLGPLSLVAAVIGLAMPEVVHRLESRRSPTPPPSE